MLDYDKTSSVDTESNAGSDDDKSIRKKSRPSLDDDEESNETNPRNIWTKRQKLPSEITNLEQKSPSKPLQASYQHIKQEFIRSNSVEVEKYSNPNYLPKRPHDHQVPNFATTFHDDLAMSNR